MAGHSFKVNWRGLPTLGRVWVMKISKERNSYRLEMLQGFEDKYGKPKPPDVLEAEIIIARYRKDEARDREAMARLSSPLPTPSLCPECYYLHGRFSDLTLVPSETSDDNFRCHTCDYFEVRKYK
jgi:hypothetical protein